MCVTDNVNNGAMVDITVLSVSIKAPWYWRSEYYLAIIIIRLVDGLPKNFFDQLAFEDLPKRLTSKLKKKLRASKMFSELLETR